MLAAAWICGAELPRCCKFGERFPWVGWGADEGDDGLGWYWDRPGEDGEEAVLVLMEVGVMVVGVWWGRAVAGAGLSAPIVFLLTNRLSSC